MKLKPEGCGFPKRLPRDSFPDGPPTPTSKLPVTLTNIQYLLDECEIDLRYDVIKKIVLARRGALELDETDLASLANLNGLGTAQFLDFVGTMARRNPINPVADWITGKAWDGEDRLPAFYATVTVQEGYPEYLRDRLLYRWLLACVAAALVPKRFAGRGVLTFQGEQGIGKTRWLKRLVPEPMTNDWVKLDHHMDGNKDTIIGAMSHWIVELGELETSFKRDIGRLKGTLTRDCDKLRLPYARSPIELDRRTVFAATVNEWHFLIDTTGNTRWWTIAVDKLDHCHDIDMQQVFAQIAQDYHRGEQWWLTEAEHVQLEALNSRHQAASVIEERIRERIDPQNKKPRYLNPTKLLEEIGFRYVSNSQAKEAGAVLRSIYGSPKKINGIMKWRVALLDANMAEWQAREDDEEY